MIDAAMFPVDLADWPAAVLRIDAAGTVIASNGRLDAALGIAVAGKPLPALLDRDTCLAKWERMQRDGSGHDAWELLFCTDERVLEPRAFTVVRDDDGLWLVEHPETRRGRELAREVSEVNAELVTAQRALVIERSRLAVALREVERSNRALDEFGMAISHDLKAPLRAIADAAEVVAAPGADATERQQAASRLVARVARMRQMIDAALQYARAGRVSDRLEPVDVGALVRDIVTYLAPHTAAVTVEPGLPTIVTEREPLEQVFRNLIENAVRHASPDAPRVVVSASAAGRDWEFRVRDNGAGIPAAQQEQIWRLFHTTRPGDGAGLGLALVRRIVEAQGGAITVASPPGAGAEFSFRWPSREGATDAAG